MVKFDEPFRDQEIFVISLFWTVQQNVFVFFCSFWLIFSFLDSHIFADADPVSQNIADLKHWIQSFYLPRNMPARRSPIGPMGNPFLVWSRIPKLYDWWTVNTSSRDRNSRSTISRGINPLSSRGFLNHEEVEI